MKTIKWPKLSTSERIRIALSRSDKVYTSNTQEYLSEGRLCLGWDGSEDVVDVSFLCLGYLVAVNKRKDKATYRIQTDTCELDFEHCRVIDRWACPQVIFVDADGIYRSGHLIGFTEDSVDGEKLGIIATLEGGKYYIKLKNIAYACGVQLGLEVDDGAV